MNLDAINLAINEAYTEAIANGGQRVMPHSIASNTTLQTDVYVSSDGIGFRVVCIIKRNDGAFVKRVKNYGPDTGSEINWPQEGVEIALQNAVKPYYLP